MVKIEGEEHKMIGTTHWAGSIGKYPAIVTGSYGCGSIWVYIEEGWYRKNFPCLAAAMTEISKSFNYELDKWLDELKVLITNRQELTKYE